METLIRARRDVPFSDAVEIHLAERKEFGLYVAQPAIFKEALEGENTVPFLRLRMQEAQRLMDELWGCGLRPSEGTGSAGSLRATEKHLSDMQRIAFMLLERPNAEVSGAPSNGCAVASKARIRSDSAAGMTTQELMPANVKVSGLPQPE